MVSESVHSVRIEAIEHWNLNRLPSIQSKPLPQFRLVDLGLEPVILHFEELYFFIQSEDDLLFRVHLHNWLVLDVHSSRRIIEC